MPGLESNIIKWYNRGIGVNAIKRKLVDEYGYGEEDAIELVNKVIRDKGIEIESQVPAKPTTPPPEGSEWVYDPKSKQWVPMLKSARLKVGDKVVFSSMPDMEPGIVRKIVGNKVWVDIGQSENYITHISTLVKVRDTANNLFIQEEEDDNSFRDERELIKAAVNAIDERNKIEDILKEVQAKIRFEDEFQPNEWIGQYTYQDNKVSNFELGEKVRRIGTNRIGTIIRIDHNNNFYRVKWDDNTITTNWRQELSAI